MDVNDGQEVSHKGAPASNDAMKKTTDDTTRLLDGSGKCLNCGCKNATKDSVCCIFCKSSFHALCPEDDSANKIQAG